MEKSTVANHLTREEGDTRKEQKDHGVEAQSTENVDNTRRLDGGLPFHRWEVDDARKAGESEAWKIVEEEV